MWLPLMRSPLGDLACNPGIELTGNQTGNLLVLRLAFNPLSHTSQGIIFITFFIEFIVAKLTANAREQDLKYTPNMSMC